MGRPSRPVFRQTESAIHAGFTVPATGAAVSVSSVPTESRAARPAVASNPFGPATTTAKLPVQLAPGLLFSKRALTARRSWFGWLWGGNRRRERGRLIQSEMPLQSVRPVRNNLRDEAVALVERRQSKVLWETPSSSAPRADQGHAWNRLRGRRLENLVIKPD